MAIDHKLITPMMSIDDPMLSSDILGSGGGRYAFRINQDTLVTNETLEYVLAYRRECMTNRGLIVPADYERTWRVKQAPLWTPEHLSSTTSTLEAWWKADTIHDKADGAAITSIDDDSDNSNTLTSSTASMKLRHVNGLNMIDMTDTNVNTGDKLFAADDDSLDMGLDAFEWYFLWAPNHTGDAPGQCHMFFDKRAATSDDPQFYLFPTSGRSGNALKLILRSKTSQNQSSDDLGYGSLVIGDPYLMNARRNTNARIKFSVNGAAKGGPTGAVFSDFTTSDGMYIGNSDYPDQEPTLSAGMGGYLGEAIIVNSGATDYPSDNAAQDADREIMVGYLAHKWGFDLPSGHTYETSPPRLDSVFT